MRALDPGRRALGTATVIVSAAGSVMWMRATGPTATTGSITDTIQITASAQPVDRTAIDFGAPGEVVSVNVAEGQQVEAGTVLAQLDTAPLSTALSQAAGALGTAQGKLAQDERPVSAEGLASGLGTVATAQDQVKSVQATVTDTERVNAKDVAAAENAVAGAQQAGKAAVATAQAQAHAAQVTLSDTLQQDREDVAAAQLALTQARQGAATALASASAQAIAAQSAVIDAQRVGAASVAAAQVGVRSATAAVQVDQHQLSTDQAKLSADRSLETSDCNANPNSAQCLADHQTVAADQSAVTADQRTLAQDQIAVQAAQVAVTQAQATATQNLDQAKAQQNAAAVALRSVQAATPSGDSAALVALQQAQTKAQANDHQAQLLVNAAQLDLQTTQAAAAGSVQGAQVALDQELARAQQSDDQARVQFNAANVALSNAQRALAALQSGPIGQVISGDQQAIDAAQASVALAQQNLDNAQLVAPVKGVVQGINAFVGQKIEAGVTSSANHAVVLFTPGAVQFVGPVSDARIREVKLGDRVSVVPAGSATSIPGMITQVSPNPVVRPGSAPAYDVTATMQATNLNLLPGSSGKMTVVIKKSASAVLVPKAAVHDVGPWKVVLVPGAKRPLGRPVTVGATDGDHVEITSGLAPGDPIVTR
jgi:multidrug efflux pump subunit AcrA (membrane-fusion protein)